MNAKKFKFNFLEDGFDDLPIELQNAIKSGKKIIALANPPSGTARGDKNISESKSGIGKNKINDDMLKNKLGEASKQLYTQFIYRLVTEFNITNICMFSPNLFLTSESFKNFRETVMGNMVFKKGFIFNAEEFDGTSQWPILFSVWSDK
jgi:hypothetical protein